MSGNSRETSSSKLCPAIFLGPQVQIYVRKYSCGLCLKSLSGNIRDSLSPCTIAQYNCKEATTTVPLAKPHT